jgi:hypothetical protein
LNNEFNLNYRLSNKVEILLPGMDNHKEFEQSFIKGTIDRIEGKVAVVKLNNKQELNWPVIDLPTNIGEGSLVRLVLSTDEAEQKVREKLARTILNQILKNNKEYI